MSVPVRITARSILQVLSKYICKDAEYIILFIDLSDDRSVDHAMVSKFVGN